MKNIYCIKFNRHLPCYVVCSSYSDVMHTFKGIACNPEVTDDHYEYAEAEKDIVSITCVSGPESIVIVEEEVIL